jgi:hypothetical protein
VPYAKPWTTNARQPPPLDRRVWVDLDRLYGTSPKQEPGGTDPQPAPHHVIHPTGRVPGVLKWWQQATDRRWYGRVDFPVYDPHGAIMLTQRDVLVPAEALRLSVRLVNIEWARAVIGSRDRDLAEYLLRWTSGSREREDEWLACEMERGGRAQPMRSWRVRATGDHCRQIRRISSSSSGRHLAELPTYGEWSHAACCAALAKWHESTWIPTLRARVEPCPLTFIESCVDWNNYGCESEGLGIFGFTS